MTMINEQFSHVRTETKNIVGYRNEVYNLTNYNLSNVLY